jgi:tyrosyl-tRNA synthetase
MGGDDQWSNMLAGTDLIRRKHGRPAWCLTFPLLATARGEKMGKTAAGAIWLDAAKTSPYEFFQYWVNTDDRDVARFLAYFTFLPMDEVRALAAHEGAQLNASKQRLAFEVTALAHGREAAEQAMAAAQAAFGGAGDLSALPHSSLPRDRFQTGVPLLDLLVQTGLADSKSAARRLVVQGGAYLNDAVISDPNLLLTATMLDADGALMLRAGKKKYHRVIAEG